MVDLVWGVCAEAKRIGTLRNFMDDACSAPEGPTFNSYKRVVGETAPEGLTLITPFYTHHVNPHRAESEVYISQYAMRGLPIVSAVRNGASSPAVGRV